jgi:hypothetical protein
MATGLISVANFFVERNKMSKVKFYSNPQRNSVSKPERYVPHYQAQGINPAYMRGIPAGSNVVVAGGQPVINPNDNPRTRPEPMALPYATDGSYESDYEFYDQTHAGVQIPNVGNVDNSWNYESEASGNIIDDINIDVDDSSYDENVYLESGAQNSQAHLEDQSSIHAASKYDYVLIFEDSILKVGDLNSMDPIIHSLLDGTHDLSRDKKVSVDDIILLKRVKIKFGLFFED